jgi:hypothetical protein
VAAIESDMQYLDMDENANFATFYCPICISSSLLSSPSFFDLVDTLCLNRVDHSTFIEVVLRHKG